MNRIQLFASKEKVKPPPHPSASTSLEQALASSMPLEDTQLTFFGPLHYEPNYEYPLVIWLHGDQGDQRQLLRVMPLISTRNYVAVAPRGHQSGDAPSGYTWQQSLSGIRFAEDAVLQASEQTSRKFNVSQRKIFLAGYGCGGTMALRIGLMHPERFAGVLSLCGAFPSGFSPLCQLEQIRRLPLFLAQGRESDAYPVHQTCEELRLFHVAGMSVTLRQYPCGDEITTNMLHDMDVWMMELVTGCRQRDEPDQLSASEIN